MELTFGFIDIEIHSTELKFDFSDITVLFGGTEVRSAELKFSSNDIDVQFERHRRSSF